MEFLREGSGTNGANQSSLGEVQLNKYILIKGPDFVFQGNADKRVQPVKTKVFSLM